MFFIIYLLSLILNYPKLSIKWYIIQVFVLLSMLSKILIIPILRNKIKLYFVIKDLLNIVIIILISHNYFDIQQLKLF